MKRKASYSFAMSINFLDEYWPLVNIIISPRQEGIGSCILRERSIFAFNRGGSLVSFHAVLLPFVTLFDLL